MNQFNNSPSLSDSNGERKIKSYVHQPLTFEHGPIHCEIKSNGKVVVKKVDETASNKEEVVYDEIEMPASLVFKLVNALKLTRNIQYLTMAEIKSGKGMSAAEAESAGV